MSNEDKILADPYFSKLYVKEGLRAVKAAGYFEDSLNSEDDIDYMLNIPTTPISRASSLIKTAVKPCVLLAAGSFCPPHDGHISMMDAAKKEMERRGYDVIAGYLSPGHPEYIDAKTKEGTISVQHRLKMCNDLTMPTGWIFVDPWEGVFNKGAINFTRVLYRMEQYMKHNGIDAPVFFVCGGDNANFASAFKYGGNCIVINRPSGRGTTTTRYVRQKHSLDNYKNIIFVSDACNSMSSTKMRRAFSYKSHKKRLFLRLEKDIFENLSADPYRLVNEILSPEYNWIDISSVQNQLNQIHKLIDIQKAISLDSMVKLKYNLRVSRHYDYFGLNWLRFAESPGAPKIDEQIKSIPTIEEQNMKNPSFGVDGYILYDDDVQGGGTMRHVTQLLDAAYKPVSGFFSFMMRIDGEVLDLRDFLIYEKDCGLVVELPDGRLSRVPYMYPYVCPYSRASVNNPMTFSIRIWEYNAAIYENSKAVVSDLTEMWPMIERCGFDGEMTVHEWCAYHINLLTKFV